MNPELHFSPIMHAFFNANILRLLKHAINYRRMVAAARVLAVLVGLSVMPACSKSAAVDAFNDGVPTASVNVSSQEPLTLVPAGLLLLEDEPGLLAAIPDVYASQTLANSGLQVAYTHPDQLKAIPALTIEAQWRFMQSCLQQVAVAPVVVIRDGPVTPFTSQDDVIHSIEGIPIASASIRTSVVIQVRDTDFDGSLGKFAFNLRSIMGRYLWLAADLPERDYPFSCAQQQP